MVNKKKSEEDNPLRPCNCWLDVGMCKCDMKDSTDKLGFPYWEEIPKFNKKNGEK